MGNGVSRTYPVGILKTTPKVVRFGKPEIRIVHPNRWETTPLLDTHEVKRVEARIRAMQVKPMEKPKPVPVKVIPKKDISNRKLFLLGGLACATGVACAAGGPFGLIIPAVALVIWGIVKVATHRPAISDQHKQATIAAMQHLETLARKYEADGAAMQAEVYRNMAMQYRTRLKL